MAGAGRRRQYISRVCSGASDLLAYVALAVEGFLSTRIAARGKVERR